MPPRSKSLPRPDGPKVLREVLEYSKPRVADDAPAAEIIRYAVRFAERMADCIARDLQDRFDGIEASPKRKARSVGGSKQLDVNYSRMDLGLGLGISLKSVHIRDKVSKLFTHNKKRNEEELRIEATGYHKRQPYAVMVGVLFLPYESCVDGKSGSSFGSWVRHLRPYAGRLRANDEADRFEKIYVALYEIDGSDLRFFDVDCDPPKNGRPPLAAAFVSGVLPTGALTYADFLAAVHHEYLRRNNAEFRWADGEEDPVGTDQTGDEDE